MPSVLSRVDLRGALRVLAVTGALLTSLVPSAGAAIPLMPLAQAVTPLYTDGARWAAFEPAAGTTRVIDGAAGRTSERPDPVGCEGGLRAIGSGELLYRCIPVGCPSGYDFLIACPIPGADAPAGYWDARYVVEDLFSGSQHPAVGADHLPYLANQSYSWAEPQLEGIGKRWVQELASGHRDRAVGSTTRLGELFFLNWHTGEILIGDGRGGRDSIDLDRINRLRRLCAPLKRIRSSSELANAYGRAFLPLELAPPFAVTAGRLVRCGSTRSERLPDAGGKAQLGGGVVSWIGSGEVAPRLLASRLSRGRRLHGRLVSFSSPSGAPREPNLVVAFQHTASTVYESIQDGHGDAIYWASIP